MHPILRELRCAIRLTRVGLMILAGIAIVRLLFPFWSPQTRRRVKQRWAGLLVASLGIRLSAHGQASPDGLVVSNHISWLDVFVINAVAPTTFVCKADVRDWPGIGWLVEHTGTLFIDRNSRSAAARSAQEMSARLQQGERIAIFPEGTTTGGEQLLPFKPALFESAAASAVGVQPVAIRYTDAQGRRSRAPAYDGDISFAASLLALGRAHQLTATLTHLPSLPSGLDRREYSQRSGHVIAAALGLEHGGDRLAA